MIEHGAAADVASSQSSNFAAMIAICRASPVLRLVPPIRRKTRISPAPKAAACPLGESKPSHQEPDQHDFKPIDCSECDFLSRWITYKQIDRTIGQERPGNIKKALALSLISG